MKSLSKSTPKSPKGDFLGTPLGAGGHLIKECHSLQTILLSKTIPNNMISAFLTNRTVTKSVHEPLTEEDPSLRQDDVSNLLFLFPRSVSAQTDQEMKTQKTHS